MAVEFVGANSTQYGKQVTEITDADRAVINKLVEFGGMDLATIESAVYNTSSEEMAGIAGEVRGYFRGIAAMKDAGFYSAWETCGAQTPGDAESEAALIDRFTQHNGFQADWMEAVESMDASNPKVAAEVAEVKGYKQCIAAINKAGLKSNWIDNRKQMF